MNHHPLLPGIIARSLFTLLISLLLWTCANVVAPTGGPRDEDPPVVLRSTPPNYSPNYSGEQIRVYFDEFVTLSNLRQQLLISPPMENDPEIRVRGRSIIIDIEEELRENTTYNMFLGDAIRDITEGNVIPNYQFVFSTGDYVDSLSVDGKVIDAFTLEPVEGVSIMLYDSIYDSIPYLERPVYFARTSKEGLFTISNMRGGEYLLFGLVDNNANFLYDLPDEKIAFLDSLVVPRYVPPPAMPDTLVTDTIMPDAGEEGERGRGEEGERERGRDGETERRRDGENGIGHRAQSEVGATLAVAQDDEPAVAQDDEPAMPLYTLYLFQEADTVQRITSTNVIRKGQISFSFRVPFDSVCVRDLSGELPPQWYIPEFSENRDTLTIWFSGIENDTLLLEAFDGIYSLDTLRIATRPRVARGRTATEPQDDLPPLIISPTARTARPIPYFLPLTLKASAPIDSIDHQKISMLEQDSIPLHVSFRFKDHTRRLLVMEPIPEQGQSYKLEIMPGAFTDIFSASNDTITISYTTTSFEDYGVIIMNISLSDNTTLPNGEQQYILQLLDSGGSKVTEKIIRESGIYHFPNLTAGNYGFRLIEDRNKNGKWDTGNYLRGIQPERVVMFPESVLVRQNWESEMSWEIQIKPITLHGQ